MTQEAVGRVWSFLDRIFPATQQPSIAFEGPPAAFGDDEDDDDDSLRPYRDESYYWGWCMYGHW